VVVGGWWWWEWWCFANVAQHKIQQHTGDGGKRVIFEYRRLQTPKKIKLPPQTKGWPTGGRNGRAMLALQSRSLNRRLDIRINAENGEIEVLYQSIFPPPNSEAAYTFKLPEVCKKN